MWVYIYIYVCALFKNREKEIGKEVCQKIANVFTSVTITALPCPFISSDRKKSVCGTSRGTWTSVERRRESKMAEEPKIELFVKVRHTTILTCYSLSKNPSHSQLLGNTRWHFPVCLHLKWQKCVKKKLLTLANYSISVYLNCSKAYNAGYGRDTNQYYNNRLFNLGVKFLCS